MAIVAAPVQGGMDRKGRWRQSMSEGLWQDGIHGRVRQALNFFNVYLENNPVVVVAVVAAPAEGGYKQKCQLETATA